MKFKKFVSLSLALIMMLALSVAVFATEEETTSTGNVKTDSTQTTVLTASTEAVVLDLTVSNAAAVIFNPYKMQVTTASWIDADYTTAQIISQPVFIENATGAKLAVSASVTTAIPDGSQISFATAIEGVEAGTANKVYAWWEIAKTADGETEPDWDNVTVADTSKVVLKSGEAKKADVIVLEAKGADDDNNYACFHINGVAASLPTKAWKAADTFTTTVVLTFVPTNKDVTPAPTAAAPASTGD